MTEKDEQTSFRFSDDHGKRDYTYDDLRKIIDLYNPPPKKRNPKEVWVFGQLICVLP